MSGLLTLPVLGRRLSRDACREYVQSMLDLDRFRLHLTFGAIP
jgi:hypothetical protein